jgi:hypothetical protein
MGIQVVKDEQRIPGSTNEYVSVRVQSDPLDHTVTLVTIERIVEKRVVKEPGDSPWHVRTLVCDQPMSPDAAIGFATCYAERKQIPVVYANTD